MFKLKEESDGTHVFVKETGEFVCVVRGVKYKSDKPVAVGHPIPRSAPAPVDASKVLLSRVPVDSLLKPNGTLLPHAFRWGKEFPDEVNKDYFEDCITNDQFCETLNLISRDKLQNTNMKNLNYHFPYRAISRVEETNICPSKFCDEMNLSCDLMCSRLKGNPLHSKHFNQTEEELVASFNKSAAFCNEAELSSVRKLRSRQKMLQFPYTYEPQEKWLNLDHTYSFTNREKYEKLYKIETGYTIRTHFLLKQCKPFSIRMKSLTGKEIADIKRRLWLKGRMQVQAYHGKEPLGNKFFSHRMFHPGLRRMLEVPEDYKKLKVIFRRPVTTPQPSFRREKESILLSNKKRFYCDIPLVFVHCEVPVVNVLENLSQHEHACYIQNTTVKVRDLNILPVTLWEQAGSPTVQSIMLKNFNRRSSQRSNLLSRIQAARDASCSVPPKTKPSISESKDVNISESVKAVRHAPEDSIPCINISDSDTEHTVCMFRFQCHGCNFKATHATKEDSDKAIKEHMDYHSVAQPESFLKVFHLDDKVVIEAFSDCKSFK